MLRRALRTKSSGNTFKGKTKRKVKGRPEDRDEQDHGAGIQERGNAGSSVPNLHQTHDGSPIRTEDPQGQGPSITALSAAPTTWLAHSR